MTATNTPTKDEMERLLPPSLPAGWDELFRTVDEGTATLVLGHRSPSPRYSAVEWNNLQYHHIGNIWALPAQVVLGKVDLDAYDFIAPFRITHVQDAQVSILDLQETRARNDSEMEEAARMMEEAMREGNLSEEDRKLFHDVQQLMRNVREFQSIVEEGEYLGEKARTIPDHTGRPVPTSVAIGRFVVDGPLVGSERLLFPGELVMHSLQCYETRFDHQGVDRSESGYPSTLTSHGDRPDSCEIPDGVAFLMLSPYDGPIYFLPWEMPPPCSCGRCTYHSAHGCSTLGAEGFIHREQAEDLLKAVFSGIRERAAR